MRGAVRAIRVGCQLVPVFLCTCKYSLIHVAQISIGEGKISLVVTVDLGSGGEILRGSSPLLGKSFEYSNLRYKSGYTLKVFSQYMRACVIMFELVLF